MRPSTVRLIDLGFEGDFASSMSFAQSLIQALTARSGGSVPADIEFIRTRAYWTIATALQHRAAVIHVMAHGMSSEEMVGFVSEDEKTELSLVDLAEQFAADSQGIDTGLLFADACDSGSGRFVRAMRDCLQHDTAYIGATRSVSWHESTTFAAAFYGSSLTGEKEKSLRNAHCRLESGRLLATGH